MDSLTKDDMHVAQNSASNSDIEDATIGTTYEVKRDLGRRHINMIAIAGMIVSHILLRSTSHAPVLTCVISRVPDCSWHPARQLLLPDQSALCSDIYAWG